MINMANRIRSQGRGGEGEGELFGLYRCLLPNRVYFLGGLESSTGCIKISLFTASRTGCLFKRMMLV